MATDLEKLVVSLSADIKSYERGLAKATGVTTAQLRKIEGAAAQSMGRVEKSFSRAGSALAGFGKGLVIGGILTAVAGLEQLVVGSISSAAAIGDLSDKLGITSDKLQELQFGAVQANMSFEELETSLLKFSKSLGQARNGQGDLLKTLEANGFDKAKIKAMSYSEALDTVADLVKNAATEQDALLIITQAFGKGGDEMLEFLRQGSDGLNQFGAAAHDAGAIIDAELIASAQRFDDAWAAALLNVKAALTTFVLEGISNTTKLWNLLTNPPKNGVEFMRLLHSGSTELPAAAIPLTQSGPGKGSLTPTKIFDPEVAAQRTSRLAAQKREDTKQLQAAEKIHAEYLQRMDDAAIEAGEKQLELDKKLLDSKMELAEAAYGAFEAIAIGGEKAADVIEDLAKSLLKAAMQAALFGSGPLSALFGTGASGGVFGGLLGKRASGGHVNANKPYMVGERGRELFVPSQSGSIVPKSSGGASGWKLTVNNFAGVDVKTSQDSGGNPMITLRKMVADVIGGGFADGALLGRHGLQPQKARR